MAPKLTGYGILNGTSAEELAEVVREYMNKGWQPIGGATPTVNDKGHPILIQTIVFAGPENHPGRLVKG